MTATTDLGQEPTADPGSDVSDDEATDVPTWVWIVLALLVVAILGGIFVLLVANREQDQPELVQDMFELADGIEELNGHVATLNEQLAALLAAAEGISGDAQAQLANVNAQLDELRNAVAKTKSDLDALGSSLGAEQDELRDQLEEIEDSIPSAPPSTTLPEAPAPTGPGSE